jgi:hypothetical protein
MLAFISIFVLICIFMVMVVSMFNVVLAAAFPDDSRFRQRLQFLVPFLCGIGVNAWKCW